MTKFFFSAAYFFLVVFASHALADSRQTTAYTYDAAGNIVGIATEASDALPMISSVQPSTLRVDTPSNITVFGTGLHEALVSTDAVGLTVTNISTSETEVSFTLNANSNVSLGEHDVVFTTLLGSASAQVDVQPPLPLLNIAPVPAIISIGGSLLLDIRLTANDIQAHSFTVTSSDSSTVTITTPNVTIPAGSLTTDTPIILNGLQAGNAQLSVTSTTFPERQLSVQVSGIFSPSVDNANGFYSSILGVTKDAPDAQTPLRGPITSWLGLQVVKGEPAVNPNFVSNQPSQSLGLIKGSAVQSVSPQSVLAGASTVNLIVSGVGLSQVDSVELVPNDGVTLGNPIAAADGLTVTVPISVDADLPFTPRHLQLFSTGQIISSVNPLAGQFFVGGGEPLLSYVKPITASRLSHFTLELGGQHLLGVKPGVDAITIEPAAGLTIGSDLVVNNDGTLITVSVAVDEFAELGPRVVRVNSVAGQTTASLLTTNTLHITNGPGDSLTPLTAHPLGVVKADASSNTVDLSQLSEAVLVVKGPFMSALSPSSQAVGSQFTLSVEGEGLDAVDSASFIPDGGITVGAVTPSVDGQSVTLDITLSNNADANLRQLQLFSGSDLIRVSSSHADRFLILPPQPSINYITPLNIQAGGESTQLVIQGNLLSDLSQVLILPSDDITLGSPTVNLLGTEVTVTINAAANAVRGNRTVVVETSGGQSSNTAGVNNTVSIVSDITYVATPVLSTLLGVNKTVDAPTSTINPLLVSAGLSVEKLFDSPPLESSVEFHTALLQVTKGVFADAINPMAVAVGTTNNLVINGSGLNTVTGINIEPLQGLTINNFSSNPEGTALNVSLDVEPSAAQTLRAVSLITASGEVAFTQPQNNRLLIANVPVVASIEPLLVVQDTVSPLVIRGVNLQDVVAIEATPATGISFNNFQSNAEGTEITMDVVVAIDAPPGPRVITVTTMGGTSSSVATETNTMTVVE